VAKVYVCLVKAGEALSARQISEGNKERRVQGTGLSRKEVYEALRILEGLGVAGRVGRKPAVWYLKWSEQM